MMSKKIWLLVSGIIVMLLIFWDVVGNYRLCDFFIDNGSAGKCPSTLASLETMLLPVIPLFIFYLIVFFLKDDVYRTWSKFVIWWIPLSMLAIFMAPEYSHDWMFRVEKGSVALAMSAIFIIVSVLIIIVKYLSLKKGR